MAADPTAIIGLLWTVATTLHDRVGDHYIGKTDIRQQLTLYQTFVTQEESKLIKRGLTLEKCHADAYRLLKLHKAVGEWLLANGFKINQASRIKRAGKWLARKTRIRALDKTKRPGTDPTQNVVRLPHTSLGSKSKSFRQAVADVQSQRNLLKALLDEQDKKIEARHIQKLRFRGETFSDEINELLITVENRETVNSDADEELEREMTDVVNQLGVTEASEAWK